MLRQVLCTSFATTLGMTIALGAFSKATEATWELSFGTSNCPSGSDILQLADNYHIKFQDNAGNRPYYVGLAQTRTDPNTRPAGADAPVVTSDETGNW